MLSESKVQPPSLQCDSIHVVATRYPNGTAKRSASGRGWKSIALCLAVAGLCSAHRLYATPVTTTTVLQLSSGATVGNGVAVTLTATVTANGSPVSPGFVTFCDASAKYCEDLAVLGMAAVNSSGIASMKKVLAPGTHKISAYFNPTVTNATSISTVQTVDVPVQVKALPVPIITKAGTSNPLPVQASVSVLGSAPFTGTLSIVQDQGREALATMAVGKSTASFGFSPLASYIGGYDVGPPISIAGDFYGDGLPDLVTSGTDGPGGFSSGLIYLSRNDPAHPGEYLPPELIALSDTSYNVVAGDFNNDGALDIVVQHYPGSNYLLLNDPANPGQFHYGSYVAPPYSAGPYQVVADLNQDGVLDLISNDYGIDIIYGDPANPGQFINPMSLPSAGGSVVVADFNGDGILDLAASYSTPNAYGISVFMGNSANPGHFLPPVNYALSTEVEQSQIVAGDFNQDGHPDLAVLLDHTDLSTAELNVLLNDPKSPGSFLPKAVYPAAYSNSLTVGDFNGDGILDLAELGPDGATVDSGSVFVFPGDPSGNGRFLPAQSYPVSADLTLPPYDYVFLNSITAADLNADGLSDLIVGLGLSGNDQGVFPANVLLNQETQTASVSFPSVAWDPSKSPLAQALYSGDDNYDIIGSCDIDLGANSGAPVLYDIHADVSNTAATVLWYWMGDDGAIDYGTTTALGSSTGWQRAAPNQLDGPSYIRLTGLAPATKYYYRIRAIGYFSGCSHWTTTSPIGSFTTAP